MISKEQWDSNYISGYTPWRRTEINLEHWLRVANIHNGTALDLGCGTGEIAIWFCEQGFEVEALDFSSEALSIAKEQSNRPRFVEWDLEKLDAYDFQHEEYDLIVDSKVLPFIQDREKYLDVIRRKLQGVFVLHVIVEHDEKPEIYIPENELEELLEPRFQYLTVEQVPTREGKKVLDYYLTA